MVADRHRLESVKGQPDFWSDEAAEEKPESFKSSVAELQTQATDSKNIKNSLKPE